MGNEHGEWIMYGVGENDSICIKSAAQLIEYVNEVGFLPLFKNTVDGFSVEERTVSKYWWSGHEERDPWEWRRIISGSHKVAYGKFFDKKAGYISLEWLPVFANYRRDGYDFDAKWDDELASRRQKMIMDCFNEHEELFSYELKELAGFGKGGEKNFDGIVTELQMETYLTVKDFRKRKNKEGREYGWDIAVYARPEDVWGEDFFRKEYKLSPEESKQKIITRIKELYPNASQKDILRITG